MRRKIIAGNWKMNGTIAETKKLIADLLTSLSENLKCEVVICPPFSAMQTAAGMIADSSLLLGAQEMSQHKKGAYTGDISAEMLLEIGASHVILGHSERRQYYAETDQTVNIKASTALREGLTPIVCVGETLEQRESGHTEAVVGNQIETCLAAFSSDFIKRLVVAYEPVWAIGTGKTASPEMAEEVHKLIRRKVSAIDKSAADDLPILYGGSVKPDNARSLLSQPNIDGALVGGASLVAEDFIAIINSV